MYHTCKAALHQQTVMANKINCCKKHTPDAGLISRCVDVKANMYLLWYVFLRGFRNGCNRLWQSDTRYINWWSRLLTDQLPLVFISVIHDAVPHIEIIRMNFAWGQSKGMKFLLLLLLFFILIVNILCKSTITFALFQPVESSAYKATVSRWSQTGSLNIQEQDCTDDPAGCICGNDHGDVSNRQHSLLSILLSPLLPPSDITMSFEG